MSVGGRLDVWNYKESGNGLCIKANERAKRNRRVVVWEKVDSRCGAESASFIKWV